MITQTMQPTGAAAGPQPETPTQGEEVQQGQARSIRVLIAGAGGMIGSAIEPYLTGQGHEVSRLVRRAPGEGEVRWDPDGRTIDAATLEGYDAVIHVASLPQERWTADFKKRWYANHVGTNRLLAESLAHSERKPSVLVCASAQGIYAPSPNGILTEDSPPGAGFLADILRDGEAATAVATAAGIRVVHLRFPTVLGGEALAGFVNSIHRGVRISRFGSGSQWYSWMARDEVPSIVEHVLTIDTLEGPVNAVSPNPVRNSEFLATLSRVLGGEPWLPMPAVVARLVMGDIADGLILASRRIAPRRLLTTGYQFRFPVIEAALRHEIRALGIVV